MNNKIIWVFGPSAVGKETFIKYTENNQKIELLARLGWVNKNIIVCDESINWVVQAENDGNEFLRKDLNNIIAEYSKNNFDAIILVKGQDLDLRNNSLNIVREFLINDEHEIIFLYTDFNILYQRYISKKWWNETMTEAVCKEWAKKQINFLISHQSHGFKIRALDSSDNKYVDINFPPVL